MLIFMKIRPVGAELFHADKWTDRTKLLIAFHNFAKAPQNHKNSIIVIFYKCTQKVLFTMHMYHICNLKKKIFLTLDKFFGKYQSN